MHVNLVAMPYAGLLAKSIEGFGRVVEPSLIFQPLFVHASFRLENCPKVDFQTWWKGEIYDNKNGIVLTRKDVVLNVANQEGFAHVGDILDYKYVAYKQKNVLNFNINGKIEAFNNIPIYATIRQISFEFIESIKYYNE